MNTKFLLNRFVLIATLLLPSQFTRAVIPNPPGGGTLELDSWRFSDTNWSSAAGYAPVAFTNLVNVTNGGDGNCLLLDTTNAVPAYLFYNLIDTNSGGSFTNLICSNGSISLWFNPDWTSTNAGGSGPGDYANLISMGYAGTNGSWWAWYLSPDGCTIYFASQTNGTSSNYLSASVSFTASNWYNLVLTYGPTNSAFYVNGVQITNGMGIAYLPGRDVTFFAVGSDTNGYYQSRGMMDDLTTYNNQMPSNDISGLYSMYSIFYMFGRPEVLTNAPPAPPTTPAPQWFTGSGFVQYVTNAGGVCVTSSNPWLTNVTATYFTNGTTSITFTIAGGSNGAPYDVFGTTALVPPHATNADWAWLGQGYQCNIYTITNLPYDGAFLILGTPQLSPDGDGLTIAFEGLVTKTSPTNAYTYGVPNAWIALNGLVGNTNILNQDPDFDGLNNWQEYLYGTKPLVNEGTNIWVGNPAGFSSIP